MSTNVYTAVEFATFASNITECVRKARTVYSNPTVVIRPSLDENEITVDETVDKATMQAALIAVVPPANLSVDNANQTVLDDGADTATYNLTGAPNETVNLSWMSTLTINKATLVLDGGGLGSFVVGPYSPGNITDAQGISIICNYATDIADGIICNVVVS
jgi:hypothetical protein